MTFCQKISHAVVALSGLIVLSSCTKLDRTNPFQPTRELICPTVSATSLSEWRDLDRKEIPKIQMGQTWREEAGQVSGYVQIARNQSNLFVFAMLPDEDIFNPVTEFNQESWSQGDIFEMFLQPEGQRNYYEFHVSPRNQRYQLHLIKNDPDSEDFVSELSTIEVESAVSIDAQEDHWLVFARIPLQELIEPKGRALPQEWQVSFSRYDYTRGPNFEEPELYSTSPHRKLWFHRQHEWTTLTVE